MPRPFPAEFRRDVVAVARKHEAPISQIAKDFGISEATLHNWLKEADIEDGSRPGVTEKEAAELMNARKRIRLLEQENEILCRAAAFFAWELAPKSKFPLVLDQDVRRCPRCGGLPDAGLFRTGLLCMEDHAGHGP
ncbi:UNVERIFIED_ORG: transposase-like protein [Arthrobacter sp. UYEF10]